MAAPKGWPTDVSYLRKPQYAKGFKMEQLYSMSGPVVTREEHGPCPLVRISGISDRAHPAKGQHGLFAARHLAPETFILFYLGFVHGADATDETSDYDLSLDRELAVGVDATMMGNEARFINDYRGIRAEGPNADFRDCWVDIGGGKVEKRIGVYVLGAGKGGKRKKGISKGDEIVVSYGKGFWAHRNEAR